MLSRVVICKNRQTFCEPTVTAINTLHKNTTGSIKATTTVKSLTKSSINFSSKSLMPLRLFTIIFPNRMYTWKLRFAILLLSGRATRNPAGKICRFLIHNYFANLLIPKKCQHVFQYVNLWNCILINLSFTREKVEEQNLSGNIVGIFRLIERIYVLSLFSIEESR